MHSCKCCKIVAFAYPGEICLSPDVFCIFDWLDVTTFIRMPQGIPAASGAFHCMRMDTTGVPSRLNFASHLYSSACAMSLRASLSQDVRPFE